jgi:hypothetical protein
MSKAYCGYDDKVPKGKKRGTMSECAETGQIRYFGKKLIDSRTAAGAANKKKKAKEESKTREEKIIEMVRQRGIANRERKAAGNSILSAKSLSKAEEPVKKKEKKQSITKQFENVENTYVKDTKATTAQTTEYNKIVHKMKKRDELYPTLGTKQTDGSSFGSKVTKFKQVVDNATGKPMNTTKTTNDYFKTQIDNLENQYFKDQHKSFENLLEYNILYDDNQQITNKLKKTQLKDDMVNKAVLPKRNLDKSLKYAETIDNELNIKRRKNTNDSDTIPRTLRNTTKKAVKGFNI